MSSSNVILRWFYESSSLYLSLRLIRIPHELDLKHMTNVSVKYSNHNLSCRRSQYFICFKMDQDSSHVSC